MARTAMSWTEAELLPWIAHRPRPPGLVGSRGHDAAVLRAERGRPVLCVDQTIEGVHAAVGAPARALGRKAAGRALSDLAATAAEPRALLLAIAAAPGERSARLRAVIESVDEKAREHGAALVGGDLAAVPGPLRLTVSALGVLRGSRRPPGRDRARPGQLVLLTGPVGGSQRGRHLEPEPRFAVARFLHEGGATALMDVSDGLALDLSRLASASSVRIDLERVPVHRDARASARTSGRTALAHALGDGEDHELIATIAEKSWARLALRARRHPGLVVVGRVRRGRGLWIADAAGALAPWDGSGGWIHGR
jgi:thiamine-monophosphate kinase